MAKRSMDISTVKKRGRKRKIEALFEDLIKDSESKRDEQVENRGPDPVQDRSAVTVVD